MHNGVITSFVSIARHLVPHLSTAAYAAISGSTDSEHFAALYITYLTDSGDPSTWEKQYPTSAMKAAMQKTISTIVALQKEHLDTSGLEANSHGRIAIEAVDCPKEWMATAKAKGF